MGKARTHQGTAKRIQVTAGGKLLRRRQMAGHLKVGKSPKRLRSLRRRVPVHPHDRRTVGGLLPYR